MISKPNAVMFLATGGYVGHAPFASGTFGSLVGLPIVYGLSKTSGTVAFVSVIVLVLGAVWVAHHAEKALNAKDPGCIVIDEVMGMFIALTLAPSHPVAWLLGFILFRIFDVFKPFPVSWFDTHLHGGIGIMMDDVMAGIYALICLQLIWLVVGRFF